jgi:phosphotransferase system IIA component
MQTATTLANPMSIKGYLDSIYVDDLNRILLKLNYMGEKIDGLVSRVDHDAHARSDADHDYVTLDVPAEQRGKLFSPAAGRLVSPEHARQNEPARTAWGRCVCIRPTYGMLYAPVTGRITAQLPSHNAIGIMTFDGVQILLTVGNAPQRYQGTAFRQLAWQNDSVHMGDPLVAWDRRALRDEGQDDLVVMTVTNPDDLASVTPLQPRVPWANRVRPEAQVMRVEFPDEG